MLGIMAGLALTESNGEPNPNSVVNTASAAPPITVVIHTGQTTPQAQPAVQTVAAETTLAATGEVQAEEAPAPVELRAQPVVTTIEVPAAPASAAPPAAETNGSR